MMAFNEMPTKLPYTKHVIAIKITFADFPTNSLLLQLLIQMLSLWLTELLMWVCIMGG